MTTLAKVFSSIGLIMVFGFLNGLLLIGTGDKGPNPMGMILGIALIAGLIAIWRSKPSKDISSNKLDKTDNGAL